MKYILKTVMVVALILYALQAAYAHKGGHHNEVKEWIISSQNTPIKASFLLLKENIVFLESEKGTIINYPLTLFSNKDQKRIIQRHKFIQAINELKTNKTMSSVQHSHEKTNTASNSFWLIGLILIGFSIVLMVLKSKYKKVSALTAVLAIFAFICASCSTDNNIIENISSTLTVPANIVSTLQSQFGHFSDVSTSSDSDYFYVSSTGIPEHNMMVGITSWQQQVPIPQDYTGSNSWAIPLQPALAENPLSTTDHFLKGAIAIAVNGIPIFNPLNNRGEDALAFGELDNWGGHSGKADDYHYHIPPTHLEAIVGNNQPIAYALDGFPIYGETTETLDQYLGILNDDGSYQYHTISTFPYFIAGMRGVVTLDPNTTAPEDQIIPQAMSKPLRGGDYGPLNGAEISNYSTTGTNAYSLEYKIGTGTYYTNYSFDSNGLYTFTYIDQNGNSSTETYQR